MRTRSLVRGLWPLLLAAACASPGPRPVPRPAASERMAPPKHMAPPAGEARVGWSRASSPAPLQATVLETTVLGTVESTGASQSPQPQSGAPAALELGAVLALDPDGLFPLDSEPGEVFQDLRGVLGATTSEVDILDAEEKPSLP